MKGGNNLIRERMVSTEELDTLMELDRLDERSLEKGCRWTKRLKFQHPKRKSSSESSDSWKFKRV